MKYVHTNISRKHARCMERRCILNASYLIGINGSKKTSTHPLPSMHDPIRCCIGRLNIDQCDKGHARIQKIFLCLPGGVRGIFSIILPYVNFKNLGFFSGGGGPHLPDSSLSRLGHYVPLTYINKVQSGRLAFVGVF